MMVALAGGVPALAQKSPAPSPTSAPVPQQQRPNVLIWMMDDVGFGQISCFGGLVETPNIDRVARTGLRYENYHTAPICSASRASFLTGRMPHSVNMGGHAAASFPVDGYNARIPASAGTIAENLHQAGYETFAVGKWDHLPGTEMSAAGPFTRWPAGQGFDRFYGFLAADTDNFTPTLMRDTSPVSQPVPAGYHLSADLADEAIEMIRSRDSTQASRPFFMYWATGAAHAPHHAPQAWLDKYRGKFDIGWDNARERILSQEIAQGVVPRGTLLPGRPAGLPAWDSLTPDQQKMYARQMEAFAASLSYADAQFGRILDALAARGELENTLVMVTSDNGASAEGGLNGLLSEGYLGKQFKPTLADNLSLYDEWGGPKTYPHYSYGWAVAGDTPYRYYKQTTHEGGIRVPLVVSWPKGIAAQGELRNQFVHVADLAPTILDVVGVPLAQTVNNVRQSPMEGESVKASFAATGDVRGGRPQYFEMYGNKSLVWQGWSINTTHRLNIWETIAPPTFTEPWELYDLVKDPGQTTNLATKYPQKVADMVKQFDKQAARYHVAPQHNFSDAMVNIAQQLDAGIAARGYRWRYDGRVSHVPLWLAPPINLRPFRMSASVTLTKPGVTGPIFAYGGQLGGMGLYLEGGKPVFIITSLKGDVIRIPASQALPTGASDLALKVDRRPFDAAGAADYHVTISASGKVLADRSLHMAVPPTFVLPETFGVGMDQGSPVLAGYPVEKPLDGAISNVVFDFSR
jgi:Arylsulfatase A and related enzymes